MTGIHKNEVNLCCEELRFDISDPDGTDVMNWNYCPYCGLELEIDFNKKEKENDSS